LEEVWFGVPLFCNIYIYGRGCTALSFLFLIQVTIFVPVPEGLRARDVDVQYTSTHIKFGLKDKSAFVDAELPKRIKTSECTWTFGTRFAHWTRVAAFFLDCESFFLLRMNRRRDGYHCFV
jgi:hypothetical protein